MCDTLEDPIDHLWCEGHWEELIAITQAELGAAQKSQDFRKEAEALASLTFLMGETGQKAERIRLARRHLRLRRAIGDPAETAGALSALGSALEWAGRPESAIFRYRQTVEAYRQLKNQQETWSHMVVIGRLFHELGRNVEALEILNETLSLASTESGQRTPTTFPEDHPDVNAATLEGFASPGYGLWERPSILRALTQVHYSLRDVPMAIRCQHEATQIMHELGKPCAKDLRRLAQLHLEQGQIWEGREFLQLALKELQQQGQEDEAEDVLEHLRGTLARNVRRRWRLTEPGLKVSRWERAH